MIQKMGLIIFKETGQDVLGLAAPQTAKRAPQSAAKAPEGESMGKAQKDAQTANMTSYGERLAARATPDMNQG